MKKYIASGLTQADKVRLRGEADRFLVSVRDSTATQVDVPTTDLQRLIMAYGASHVAITDVTMQRLKTCAGTPEEQSTIFLRGLAGTVGMVVKAYAKEEQPVVLDTLFREILGFVTDDSPEMAMQVMAHQLFKIIEMVTEDAAKGPRGTEH